MPPPTIYYMDGFYCFLTWAQSDYGPTLPREINYLIWEFFGKGFQSDFRDPIWYQKLDGEEYPRRDLRQVIRNEPAPIPNKISYDCRSTILNSLEHELFGFNDKPMRGAVTTCVLI